MDAPSIPPLFDRVPPGLFGPLGGPLAELYWSILARLYALEFEREPLFLVKVAVTDLVEELLAASPEWAQRIGEDAGADDPEPRDAAATAGVDEGLRGAARRVVARLERAGWFHYEYRATHGQVLCFYPYAARVLEALVRVARDEQPVFQGYAHAIASLLRPESFAPRPGVAIHQAKRQTLEMVRELKILERNISVFVQRLLSEVSTASGVLEEGLDRYRQAVMANYHRLKTVENLFKWRAEIVERLTSIAASAPQLESAARWYAEQFGVDAAEGRRLVEQDLEIMRRQFEAIPEVAQEIDLRNARFSGAALRKLMYLVRQDRRAEGQLQYLVESLARDEAPELPFDVFRCELLAGDFLYTPPSARARPVSRALPPRPPRDRAGVRRLVAGAMRQPNSRRQIQAYVEALLAGRPRAELSELPLDADEDYVRLIYICAYGLGGEVSYRLHLLGESPAERRQSKGRYRFPRAFVERRRVRAR